jgi:hypothetical protein
MYMVYCILFSYHMLLALDIYVGIYMLSHLKGGDECGFNFEKRKDGKSQPLFYMT